MRRGRVVVVGGDLWTRRDGGGDGGDGGRGSGVTVSVDELDVGGGHDHRRCRHLEIDKT